MAAELDLTAEHVRARVGPGSGVGTGRRRRGDHEMSQLQPLPPPLKRAAVLVPIVVHDARLTVLLTKRTDHLHDHAGQISFPGGRIEPSDLNPEHTALRETEEEIGLARGHVELVGRLDIWETRTGFEITPVVGLVTPPFRLALDAFEVADAFEVPLSFILDRSKHERHEKNGRSFWVLPFEERYIWGATAGMLVSLAEALTPR